VSSRIDLSAEQDESCQMVRRFVEAHASDVDIRKQREAGRGFDLAVWSAMAAPLGLRGLAVPEELGGQRFGSLELCIALEETGRSLPGAPYLSTAVLAVDTPLQAGDEDAQRALLPRIASGETIATVASAEPSGRWDPDGIESSAAKDGAAREIAGAKAPVLPAGQVVRPPLRRRVLPPRARGPEDRRLRRSHPRSRSSS
jgi:alkylation response protein AidB-like acyl-CoA dehydrogenase